MKLEELRPYLKALEVVLGAPEPGAPMEYVYVLRQWPRIGQVCEEILAVVTIFAPRGGRITIVTGRYERVDTPAVNRSVLEYFGRRVRIVQTDDRRVLARLPIGPTEVTGDGRTYFLCMPEYLHAPYCRAWLDGLAPYVFTLDATERERGRLLRHRYGIPEDAKLVTLHVRESGFLPIAHHQAYRDADVRTYRPAIDALLARGYHVIRLGDPVVRPLDIDDPRVVDLPHRPDYDPFAVPYFIHEAAFHLGALSGPLTLAFALGKPVLLVNAAVTAHNFHNRMVCVYKKYVERSSGRSLGYRETALSPYVDCNADQVFANMGVDLDDCTPEEILAATCEMVDDVEGRFVPDPGMLARNRSIDLEAHQARAGLPWQLGPYFATHVTGARLSQAAARLVPGYL